MSEIKKLEIDGEVFELQEYGYEAHLDIMDKAFELEMEISVKVPDKPIDGKMRQANTNIPETKTKMRIKEFQFYTVFYSLKSWADKAGNDVPIVIENMKKLSKKAGAVLFTEASKLNSLGEPEEKNSPERPADKLG